MDNHILNVEQARARYAVEAMKEADGAIDSQVKRLPAMIQANGLIYVLAYMNEKGGDWRPLLRLLEKWMMKEEPQGILNIGEENGLFQALLVEEDPFILLTATNEVLQLLSWMKRLIKENRHEKTK